MNKLLVESENDKHIILALRDKYNLPKNFEIENAKTVEQAILSIPSSINESNIDVLGIVIDTDADLQKRWRAVKAQFEEFGYQLPALPKPEGTIVAHPDKILPHPLKIGIWLMPDNQLTGAVEEFMQMLVRENDVLWKEAQLIVDKLEKDIEEKLRFPAKSRSKALIHSFLAWQNEPGRPMGFAITKKYFDADAALAKLFVKWLNDLFNNDQSQISNP